MWRVIRIDGRCCGFGGRDAQHRSCFQYIAGEVICRAHSRLALRVSGVAAVNASSASGVALAGLRYWG